MTVTVIIPSRNVVLVDGKPHEVDCSALDQSIHVIEWNGIRGVIEYKNGRFEAAADFKANERITSIAAYQALIDAWQAIEDLPPPPPPPPSSTLDDFDMGPTIANFLKSTVGGL